MIGKIQAVISGEGSSNILLDIFLYFLMAISYMKIGKEDDARKCLEQAADIAVPDGIMFPLVAYSWLLEGLPDKLIAEKYPPLKEHFEDLKERFQTGWNMLYQDVCSGNLPADLTEREAEVARLAAEGMHNNEIAEKLCVSESTVRTHLRTVFQKLDIDRRTKLAAKVVTAPHTQKLHALPLIYIKSLVIWRAWHTSVLADMPRSEQHPSNRAIRCLDNLQTVPYNLA